MAADFEVFSTVIPSSRKPLVPVSRSYTATIKVNGTTVASGTASQSIPLVAGTNTITTVVTAQDGSTTSTYTVTVTRPSLDVTYSSALNVPVTSAGYIATGNVVNVTLGFAPATGTDLMVVKNTGIAFITGRFSNLAQGQVVNLTYGGVTYKFVANYYGGTGNDLVLHWAYQDLVTWGYNSNGQLGNNSTTSSSVPVLVTQSGVLAGKTVVSVAASGSHSLALCSDGTVTAWGSNAYGELGNNSTTDSSVPVAVILGGVLAGKTVVSVAVGASHSIALCSDGTVAAWGSNSNGQLGNNSTTSSSVPVLVTQSGVLAGKSVVSVTAGWLHSLALCSDGSVAAWGYNLNGQLGNNSTTQSNVPVMVTQSGVLRRRKEINLTKCLKFLKC
ncbi:MAG: cadherin-like beta sandwich domain-containing protein, partial [Verrucomicrobiota bacterium]